MRLTEIKDPDELLTKYDKDDLIVNVKFDGWLTQVINSNGIKLFSRRGEDLTEKFPEIVNLIKIPNDTIIIGELVYWDGDKQDISKVISVAGSSLENSQKKKSELKGKFKLHIFDIIKKGKDVSDKPYIDRYKLLKSVVNPNDKVKSLKIILFLNGKI